MFNFSKSVGNCAVVIDIGSASVGVSIVISNKLTDDVEVIWSHREHSIIRDTASYETNLKEIKTTLVNAVLKLGSDGTKALQQHSSGEKVTHIQTTISAPWAYTVTKSIRLHDEHPFEITEKLFEELISSAKKQAETTLRESDVASMLDLKITHKDITNVKINGYSIQDPIGQEGRTISVAFLQTAISKSLLEALHDSLNKVLPNVKTTEYSFMYVYYATLRNMHFNASEMCLIDVTGEATEMGIVRNECLVHVTHADFGMYTLARKIAEACDIPKEEAYGFLKNDGMTLSTKLSEQKKGKFEAVLEEYQTLLEKLIDETNDELSIPKSVFLHTDEKTQEFFVTNFKKAVSKKTGGNCVIHPFTSKLVTKDEQEDTALILSQHFYHYKEAYLQLFTKE